MKGIIYLSKAVIEFEEEKLQILTDRAARKNKNLRITGYLYFEKGNFLQYIEGNNQDVDMLMNDIKKDIRHEVIYALQYPDLLSRNFSSWYMEYLTKEKLVEMKLEHLIMEQLEYIKKINALTGKKSESINKENSVWRIIKTISQSKNK